MYTYEPCLHPDDIRIVAIHPRNLSPAGSIHVTIEIHKIDQAPSYEALSYVWGDTRNTMQIIADTRTMDIGRSLHSALMQLRSDETIRTLWVDAICINQQDVVEKSHQVSRMRDIFARASSTIMWIGEENDEAVRAFETLQDLPNLLNRNKPEPKYTMFGNLILNAMDWLSLRPYFSRSWITQEIVVSSHATITCGSLQLNLDDLLGAISKVTSLQKGMNHVLGLVTLGRWREILRGKPRGGAENLGDVEKVEDQTIDDKELDWTISMYLSGVMLLGNFLQRKVEDDDDDWEDIEDMDDDNADDDNADDDNADDNNADDNNADDNNADDNNADDNNADDDNTDNNNTDNDNADNDNADDDNTDNEKIIRKTLDSLKRLRKVIEENTGERENDELNLVNLLVSERNKGATDPHDKIYALLGIASTSGNVQLETDYSKSVEELYVMTARQLIQQDNLGMRILSCSQPGHTTRRLPSWVPDWSEPWHGSINTRNQFRAGGTLKYSSRIDESLNTISIRGFRVDTIQEAGGTSLNEWELNPWLPIPVETKALAEIAALGLPERYPFTNESYASAFLEVITAGCWKSVSGPKMFEFQEYSVAGDFAINPFNVDVMKWKELLRRLSWSDGEWDVFQSEMGYLGLGPTSMQPGDIVCIFGSGQVPFILRQRRGDGYKLVGECYVHGVMYGEATKGIEPEQLEDFVLW